MVKNRFESEKVRGMRAAIVAFTLMGAVLEGSDWPQWRGPQRTGSASADERTIASLPSEPRAALRIPAGPGLASPVVQNGKVFAFDNQGGRETLRALDAASGREIWRADIDEPFSDNQGPTGPRCTPVSDGSLVFAQSCRGELKCLDSASGKAVWSVNFVRDFGAVFIGEKGNAPGATRHGNNGSPFISGDRIYVSVGSTNGAGLVCFDKRNGKVLWKSLSDQAGYAAPIILPVSGQRQLLHFSVEGIVGVDPESGREGWRIPVKTAYARHVTTPVAFRDMVVAGSHQSGLLGVRVRPVENGWRAETAWTNKECAANFSSPVEVDGKLYGLGPAKDFFCLDIISGKTLWRQPGYFTSSAEKAHAGFLSLGSRILALTDGGELVLFAADPEKFAEISRVQVCAMNWTNPALAGGRLYLRDQKEWVAIPLK